MVNNYSEKSLFLFPIYVALPNLNVNRLMLSFVCYYAFLYFCNEHLSAYLMKYYFLKKINGGGWMYFV